MDQPITPVETLMHGLPTVESVRQLEAMLLQLPQVDLATQHLVHGGMYARTIFIPADTVLTGALIDVDNVCIVYGDITVTTDDGPQRLTGFNVIPSCPGSKRAGHAHADTWWTMVCKASGKTITEIEDEISQESYGLMTRKTQSKELT